MTQDGQAEKGQYRAKAGDDRRRSGGQARGVVGEEDGSDIGRPSKSGRREPEPHDHLQVPVAGGTMVDVAESDERPR